MSITDEGHYGPKQLNLLKTVWGEGFLSPGGTDEIDEVMRDVSSLGKEILDIGCGCGGAAIHLIKQHGAKSVLGIDVEPLVIKKAEEISPDAKTMIKLAIRDFKSGKVLESFQALPNYLRDKIAIASRAALVAPAFPIAKVPTGIPLGI